MIAPPDVMANHGPVRGGSALRLCPQGNRASRISGWFWRKYLLERWLRSGRAGEMAAKAANADPASVSTERDVQGRTQTGEQDASRDARLVARVISGDGSAFDGLVRGYQRRAVAVAYRLLGNAADATDVTQDAFLRAYRNIDQLADHRRFGPWLMQIVRNLSLNFRRFRKASSNVAWDDVIETADSFRSADGASLVDAFLPADAAEAEELRSAVATAMDALPQQQRMALVLFSVEGLPQKEVARMLGCSVALVKWNVFQARKALKEALVDYLP